MGTVLVITAHPRGRASFSHALADAYAAGAAAAGWQVTRLDLSTLAFDPDLHHPSPRDQPLEPGLAQAKELLTAADHVAFFYPTWWGTFPALLKGFLDRVLVPGWAFEEIDGGTGYQGLLGGRSAELFTTMDTPGLVYRVLNGAPGHRALATATLGFCGIDVVRITRFGLARTADDAQRQRWLEAARARGLALIGGVHTPAQRLWRRLRPWLLALRLQFYPMTLLAYAVGALAAVGAQPLDGLRFWLGYLVLFLLEAATVFTNDVMDEATDRANRFWGPFSGGSRVLAERLLSSQALKQGALVAAVLGLAVAGGLIGLVAGRGSAGAVLAVLALLALSYTLPPFKLSYHGMGEVDVALTHSLGVLLFGFVVQDGALTQPLPYLLSLPLGLAVLPAILLSGVPDHGGDAAAGKRTLVVRFGIRNSFVMAMVLVAASMAAAVLLHGVAPLAWLWLPVLPHGALLLARLWRASRAAPVARRIDGLMVLALTYIIWFGAVPFIHLVRGV